MSDGEMSAAEELAQRLARFCDAVRQAAEIENLDYDALRDRCRTDPWGMAVRRERFDGALEAASQFAFMVSRASDRIAGAFAAGEG